MLTIPINPSDFPMDNSRPKMRYTTSDGTSQISCSGTPESDLSRIAANAIAEIKATTVFGNKYVSFRSPPNPTAARISSSQVIDVTHVTTEFNTLFETLTSISEKVDPVKLNLTLSAAA